MAKTDYRADAKTTLDQIQESCSFDVPMWDGLRQAESDKAPERQKIVVSSAYVEAALWMNWS